MTNLIGKSLGRYHILEQLGEGGMATVYKAYDTRLETDVAVKVIRTENLAPSALERSLKRFEREAKALARLTHPNIVKVTDFGEDEDKPYLVMEYLPGGTLKQKLGKPMPWNESISILLPIARALDFAHRQNMIHRDVKPSNILITADGEPMLTDFGIAKILDLEETADLTGTGMGIGTPEYMAPEQWTGKTSAFSDQYALGVVLYEMLTGRKPYTADTPAAILLKQATEPLPRPSQFTRDLPEKMEKLLLKVLARNPEDRYASMAEFAKALDGAISGQQPPASEQTPKRKVSSPRPKMEEKSRPETVEAMKTHDTQATVDQQLEDSAPKKELSGHQLTKMDWPIVLFIGSAIILIIMVAVNNNQTSNSNNGVTVFPTEAPIIPSPSVALTLINLQMTTPMPTVSTVPILIETTTSTEYQIGFMQHSQDAGENYDDIFIVGLDGDPIKIAGGFTNGTNFAISENGQYVAKNADGIIFYIDNLTKEEFPLIDSVYQRDYKNLSWSNDGKYIFSTVNGSYTTGNWWQGYTYNDWTKYYIVSTSDSALTVVADRSGTHLIKNVRWSPDDKFISYWESGNIFAFDPKTGQINNLTKSGLVGETPHVYSPDASQILFTLVDTKSIYRLEINTGEQTSLIDGLDGIPLDISWAPDGKKVLYSFYYNNLSQIYLYDIATKEKRFLAEGESPVWSPDSKKLLYLKNNDVFAVNVDGADQINITNSPALTESNLFWLNSSFSFAILADETVSENFDTNYTSCAWSRKYAGSENWIESQCACSGNYCSCTQVVYISKTNRTELARYEIDYEKREVEKNVSEFNGTCQ